MSWYTDSYSWIKQQELDYPALDRAELRKHCSKNYPFYQRKGHAYKSFLKAMRDVFGATRRPTQSAQTNLF